MALQWPPRSDPHSKYKPLLPTQLLTGEQARAMEPDLSSNIVAALSSPETGIVDSHTLMQTLERDIKESEGGELVYSTRVVRVDPFSSSSRVSEGGWVVQSVTGSTEEGDAILARTLISSTGLSGNLILNSLLPKNSRVPMYYARGSYASYSGPGISQISRLIYPCPETRENHHSFQSLGTHLTLDLQGKVRFGPDIEWISSPVDHQPGGNDVDFWERYLVPDDSRLEEMHKAVTYYLPGVVLDGMRPDYVGIRPKLMGPEGGFQDFVIRVDALSDVMARADGRNLMISLLGIESPGLTSSLAIAEVIVEDIIGVDM